MHIAIRAVGFSLMTMFVSCGVGAQSLDTHPGNVTTQPNLEINNGQWKMPLPMPVNPQNS
ncbi:hypothetical protein ACSFE6_13635 [Pseudomonas baetica]|uniref:hypothetical protein n=1 Tax=Pseudomonas baetica TaxID=674054 RepID=UPI003EF055EB